MNVLGFLFKTAATLISPYVIVEKGVNRIKENIKDDVRLVLAKTIKLVSITILFVVLIIFGSLFLAVYLNTILQSNFLGYGLVASFYLFLFVILMLVNASKSGSQHITKFIVGFLEKNM